MMRSLLPLAVLLLSSLCVSAQPDKDRLYTRPTLPPIDALDRLNLKLAFSVQVPTESRRDGILSTQFAPVRIDGKYQMRILVQTRAGAIVELDAESGRVLWQARVGNPYTAIVPLGFNNTEVVAARGTLVYGISRKNGDVRWKMAVRGVPATAPLLDSLHLYLNLDTNRVEAYGLSPEEGEKPIFFRNYRSHQVLQLDAAQSEKYLFYPSPRGSVVVIDKENMGLLLRYQTGGNLDAGPGVHEVETGIYLGSRDTNVYGHTIQDTEPAWRFTAGTPIERKPFVNDESVYVTAERKGLFRLHRRTIPGAQLIALLEKRGLATLTQLQEVLKELDRKAGDSASILSLLLQKGYLSEEQKSRIKYRGGEDVWNNPEGDRVLAVNPKFVYAFDKSGRLLVIDRERGRTLSRYDLRDFPVPISNEYTDRIYIASHNGLIVCLHDREFPTPVRMKALPEPAAPPPPPGGEKPPPPPPPAP